MSLPSNFTQVNGVGSVSDDNFNTCVQWCDSVNDLRNFIGLSGMTVYLQGTSAPNDGGQGSFYWNSTGVAPDDNGVTTVIPNGSVAGSGEWTRITNVITGVQNLSNAINFANGGNVASATTTPIGAAAGNYVTITGNTAITAFDTVQSGAWRRVKFSGSLTLTYNATSLILPTGANIVTAAGDTADLVSLGGGNWIVTGYQRASGAALAGNTGIQTVKLQKFTGSGTYTPSAGMVYCIIEAYGGGGGGGGIQGVGSQSGGGGGGGAGGYSRTVSSASAVGASQAVTIGSAGAAGAAGNNAGGNGGNTSVGSLCIANGGTGGGGSAGLYGVGGAGGTAGTGNITATGDSGGTSMGATITTIIPASGNGASSPVGGGATGVLVGSGTATGGNATGYGAGGSGGAANASSSTAAGGTGSAGIAIITEYCTQ